MYILLIWPDPVWGILELLGGGFKDFVIFTPICGEMIQFDLRIFVKNGLLVQPPTSLNLEKTSIWSFTCT